MRTGWLRCSGYSVCDTCVEIMQRVTDLGVEGLVPLTRLTALYLGCCHRLTDSAARHIGRGSKARVPPASRLLQLSAHHLVRAELSMLRQRAGHVRTVTV